MVCGETDYEYGVEMVRVPGPHRDHMTLDEARAWIDEWIADGGNHGVFRIIRRAIGPWEPTMQSVYGPKSGETPPTAGEDLIARGRDLSGRSPDA